MFIVNFGGFIKKFRMVNNLIVDKKCKVKKKNEGRNNWKEWEIENK